MLLVVDAASLRIRQLSENVAQVIGRTCEDLLAQPCASVLGEAGQEQLRAYLSANQTDGNPTHLLTLAADGSRAALDVLVHTSAGRVLVELEPVEDHSRADQDQLGMVRDCVSRLQGVRTLREFCEILAAEVRALTGHDRVMIYRFHADDHGEVFAESRREDLPAWLGLHYPADDIPAPAREVFKQTWIRPLPDVSGALAELVPLVDPEDRRPVVMTHCALRGPSIMYTEYLQNMQVTATLTMSLRQGDSLWGLIACHHYNGPHPIGYRARAACELLAQVGSLQLKAAQDREDAAYRLRIETVHADLVTIAAQEGGLAAMTDGKPALLDGLSASGAAIYHRDRWFTAGNVPDERVLDALLILLGSERLDDGAAPMFVTDSLGEIFEPARDLPHTACGLLAFALSRTQRTWLMWFRPETLQMVHWGGNPHDKPMVTGPHGPRLTPRRSFEVYVESVRGRSSPWTSAERAAALRLRSGLMELVVRRAERLAELNADLTRSNEELDSFAYVASHDLKEPLRGIHKYAHQLYEDAKQLAPEQREKLERLMRLTVRMDSLLDSLLHYSRVGREQLDFTMADLNEVLTESAEMVVVRLSDAGGSVNVPRPLPKLRCDRVRVREIFVNLLSNALKYNDKPEPHIEVGFYEPGSAPTTAVPHELAAHTVFYVRDNGIGIHPKHHAQVFKMFKRLHGRDDFGGGMGAGLTIVKKLVERHFGKIWIDSSPGNGSTFYFTLPATEDRHGS